MKNKTLLLGLMSIFIILAVSIVSAETITRDFSDSSVEIGDEITVTLTVDVDTESYYAVDEIIPNGFEITDLGDGNDSEAGHIKFVIIQDAEDIIYTYKIKATATGDYDFTGTYMFEEDTEEQDILGDNEISVSSDDGTDTSGNNDGGNNDGTSGCQATWSCTDWSECIDGKQTRTCTKEKPYCYAGTKPDEEKDCSIETSEIYETEENINKNKGVVSRLTGAVVGTLGTVGTWIAGVFLLGILGFIIIVRKRKRARIK